MKITNTSKGPRGLNTKDGHRWVEAGQTVEVSMSRPEAEVAKKTGWFDIEGDAESNEPNVDDNLTRDDLLALALDEKTHHKTLEKAAKQVLGDDAPKGREAIIAALQTPQS